MMISLIQSDIRRCILWKRPKGGSSDRENRTKDFASGGDFIGYYIGHHAALKSNIRRPLFGKAHDRVYHKFRVRAVWPGSMLRVNVCAVFMEILIFGTGAPPERSFGHMAIAGKWARVLCAKLPQ
jgi:hypothetical protein